MVINTQIKPDNLQGKKDGLFHKRKVCFTTTITTGVAAFCSILTSPYHNYPERLTVILLMLVHGGWMDGWIHRWWGGSQSPSTIERQIAPFSGVVGGGEQKPCDHWVVG